MQGKGLDANVHDFGGFDEGAGGLAFAELHFARGVGGDDRGNVLIADFEDDLCEQAADFDVGDGADQLIAAADVAEAFAGGFAGGTGFRFHERIERSLRDAVVAAGSLDGLDGAGEDPLFEGGIADAEGGCSFAGLE